MPHAPAPLAHRSRTAHAARSRLLPARRALLIAGMATGMVLAGCGASHSPENAVSLEQARTDLEAGRVVMFDIREPQEHATGVAPGAKLLPMSQIGRRLAEIPTDPNQPVLLICNTQNRSSATLDALREQGGYRHVRYVIGGMSEWAGRGWPLVKPGG
jgi:rhodanese-related sulfurtransferase